MTKQTLTESEQCATVDALRLAADKYVENANAFKADNEFGKWDRLIRQFNDQSVIAHKLANMLEDAEYVITQSEVI